MTNLIVKFKNLPDVLIHKILEYSDIIIFRYGKYMTRINKYDIRYEKLNKIYKPMKLTNNRILIKMMRKRSNLNQKSFSSI